MTPLVADAGAFLAATNQRHPRHRAVQRVISEAPGPIVTSQVVLAEVDYMLMTRSGVDLELLFLADVRSGAFRAECLTPDELGHAVDVIARYRDLAVGLADASLVALCARYRTSTVLTLDERCFRAMTPLTGGHFTLLPADADQS